MTEDTVSKVTDDAGSNPGATTVRQRKKRKWDQPAESMISVALPVPGMLPFLGAGSLAGIGLPGMVAPLVSVPPSISTPSAFMSVPQNPSTVSVVQQNAAAIVQKINQDLATKGLLSQSKIQDELIAREIVINDADPTVRYKLTKRQTQEEIQSKTGAVVITRGRYHPPNGPVDNEKPLYLHISAGVHLKETAERIKAVDQAAAMVEEMLKQGRQQQSASAPFSACQTPGGLATPPLITTVFVGLEADPALNIASRIRGPNDQYINHIMNETGATVVLRGRGSGNHEGPLGEELQQPLHLFISSDNLKSLDDAKRLAENLLETVRSECFMSRLSTSRVYNAVPPPQQLLTESPVSKSDAEKTDGVSAVSPSSRADITAVTSSLSNAVTTTSSITAQPNSATTGLHGTPGVVSSNLQNYASPPGLGFSYGQSTPAIYPQAPQTQQPQLPHVVAIPSGTSYSGYGGIYPQATPLQQVALALQRPPPPVSIKPGSQHSTNTQQTKAQSSNTNGQSEKQPTQRRKFQELPVAAKEPSRDDQNSHQGTESSKPGCLFDEPSTKKLLSIPLPKCLPMVPPKGMPPPPSRNMPPPKGMLPPPSKNMPPPKGMLPPPAKTMPPPQPVCVKSIPESKTEDFSHHGICAVSETNVRLVEYGEEDEDDLSAPGTLKAETTPYANGKPFWAP